MNQSQKGQYHHYIPRFILRQFQTDETGEAIIQGGASYSQGLWIPGRSKGRSASKKRTSTPVRNISYSESISFYDISKGQLSQRPLGKVYGQKNLYLDANNPNNVYHLEEKLCFLEGRAANLLRDIHKEMPQDQFTISRGDLGILRKFIYLMHYRNDALASTFFEESNPRNAPLAEWLIQRKINHNFSSNTDVWLDGLRYYLETPHHEIVSTAERLRERLGQEKVNEMFRTQVDLDDLDEFYALEYEGLANYFFLGVWKAAPGTEFILGGNGFGLWEGVIYNTPGVHRLYVVSPRIVIVLRRTLLWHPRANDPSVLHSCLAGVDISEPELTFANPNIRQQAMEAPSKALGKRLIDQYRRTPIAQGDAFTFEITELTEEETYAVNEVTLLNSNVQDDGSITFSSPTCMLDTLRAYMASKNTFLGGKKSLFNPLYETLSSMVAPELSSTGDAALPSPLEADSDADRQFHTFIRYMVLQGVKFPSDYNRSYLVYKLATTGPTLGNAFSINIRAMVDAAVGKLSCSSSYDSASSPATVVKGSPTLVEMLSANDSERFVATMSAIMDPLGVGRRSHDPLSTVAYEAAMIGVGQWIASQRGELAKELQPFIQLS